MSHKCGYPQRPEEDIRYPGTGVGSSGRILSVLCQAISPAPEYGILMAKLLVLKFVCAGIFYFCHRISQMLPGQNVQIHTPG